MLLPYRAAPLTPLEISTGSPFGYTIALGNSPENHATLHRTGQPLVFFKDSEVLFESGVCREFFPSNRCKGSIYPGDPARLRVPVAHGGVPGVCRDH